MIQGVFSRSKQFGNMFNITVDGNNYGFGPNNPADQGIEPGDTISFDTKVNGKYTNADANSVQIISKASAGGGGGNAQHLLVTATA